MTRLKQKPAHGLSQQDVAHIVREGNRERRGSYMVRPILIQRLDEFGSPHQGVLTAEHQGHLTIVALLDLTEGDRVVIYDEEAPDEPRSLSALVRAVRHAARPSDAALHMNVVYVDEELPEDGVQ